MRNSAALSCLRALLIQKNVDIDFVFIAKLYIVYCRTNVDDVYVQIIKGDKHEN